MTQYMLMFSMGPVQLFIVQARKTRDLWLGSLIFSRLMHAGMKDIQASLVYPSLLTTRDNPAHPTTEDETANVPNKYVAIFDTLTEAQGAARQSKTKIADQWKAICNAVKQQIISNRGDKVADTIWDRQTNFNTLFETYWVIVKHKEKQEYGDWFAETENMLAARKRLRDFQPQDEPGEKSSISGDREILHDSDTSRDGMRAFWKRIARGRSPNDIDQEGNERLDSIDLIKRFAMGVKGMPQKPFPSTSSIATASFVESLLTKDMNSGALQKLSGLTQYQELAVMRSRAIPYLEMKADSGQKRSILTLDGDCYFPETFTEYRLKKDYYITDAEDVKRQQILTAGSTALSALLKSSDEQGITRPTPYYAIIQMDGDDMGILLSSVKDNTEHKRISEALSSFARVTALDLVEERYPARLVYAGGDDVLALAPLARDVGEPGQPGHVLDLVDMLQTNYQKAVLAALLSSEHERRMEAITASTGMVITHHFAPLSYAVRSTLEAEHIAKKRYGKNALVVTVIRRSGEQTRAGCRWRYDGLADDGQPIALFSEFYRLFKHDILSPKCVYILLEEAPALIGLPEKAQTSEIKRVFLRQYDKEREKQNGDKTNLPGLAEQLTGLAAVMNKDVRQRHPSDRQLDLAVELHADKTRHGLIETLGWLQVMAFLARKEGE